MEEDSREKEEPVAEALALFESSAGGGGACPVGPRNLPRNMGQILKRMDGAKPERSRK